VFKNTHDEAAKGEVTCCPVTTSSNLCNVGLFLVPVVAVIADGLDNCTAATLAAFSLFEAALLDEPAAA
jgi:hypothetical protein